MDVTPQGNEGYLTEVDIRLYLRDADPAANVLIDDLEYTPEEIRAAATHTVDYWNEQPPNVGECTVYTMPFRFHLLMGTAAQLLFIAAHRFRRNALQYSVPGGGISDQAKAPQYDEAGTRLWTQYTEFVRAKKREINISQGWGYA